MEVVETNELDFTCGISDEELTRRFVEGVRLENEKKKILGSPIACYDAKIKKAYLEYADGRREFINAN